MRCDAVSGSCMLIRKELFERFNGFDNEQFGKDLYAVDLCYRLAKEGLVSLFCPDARFTCQTKERTFSLYDKNEQVKFRGRYKRQKSRANPNLRGGKPIPYAHPVHLGRALKILMVTHGLAPEGAPKSFQTLCLGLQEKEPGSKIVWSHAEGPLKNHFVQHDIPVTVLQHKKSVIRLGPGASDLDVYVAKSLSFLEMSSVDDFDLSLKMLGQRMIDKQIDVVFANTVLTFWAVLAAAQVGIPCVWVIRESEPPLSHLAALPQFVQDAAETCFAFAYRVVFVAHATKKLFQKRFPGDNFTVVHNALQSYEPLCLPKKRQQIRQKLKVKDQELLVLMLGTVFKRKGQEDFIQAISLLPEEIVENVRFVIVGDRPDTDYSHEIHELAKCLPQKRKERLVILKETTSPDDYYQAADIFLCCSRIESFPLVILEAMKYALPIITTPVFGISEQVADKESALFYPPGDAKALARQLERVVLDQNLRKKLGEGARNALNLLPTYNELIDKYYQIIREASFS
jgi:glycosyltransferase involved in cell wall biosynthesis